MHGNALNLQLAQQEVQARIMAFAEVLVNEFLKSISVPKEKINENEEIPRF